VNVRIDIDHPAVYTYTSEAKIQGRTFPQFNYVWWFRDRPAMSKDDPAAGNVDGVLLRVTLGPDGAPAFVESSLSCGCGHEVFVSSAIESAAAKIFGPPREGKRFSVEKDLSGKHDVIVVDTFDPVSGAHPLVLEAAGYHEVCQVRFDKPRADDSPAIVEDAAYNLLDYDVLDRLPFENGIASMFGPDGLVHNAGRPEGYLLAPSGMLSAGQPRKRGAQRIRWDDYLLDDPRLLEKTLRIPPLE
jgi:hypothetical protein